MKKRIALGGIISDGGAAFRADVIEGRSRSGEPQTAVPVTLTGSRAVVGLM